MWAEILTKPLQGSKFQQMRAILMNCPIDYHEEPPLIDPIIVASSPDVPIKPQILPIDPLPWECVEVSYSAKGKHGGKKKKVRWHTRLPRPSILPSTSSCCRDFH